ncbi:ATP-grasp domain-containing protein [Roseobacter weihaiensis]|uniref:ATP-grasp domain-containing protein n=1 Tax=Roseobacter weihaiensis TaxID=2763262 RepID=UPI001D0BB6DA|nr:ATP-grasp domain-containing protein [Roseobacter sp. H9]
MTLLLTHPYRAALFRERTAETIAAPLYGNYDKEDALALDYPIELVAKESRTNALRQAMKKLRPSAVIITSPHDNLAVEDANFLSKCSVTTGVGVKEPAASVFASKSATKELLQSYSVPVAPDLDIAAISKSTPAIGKPDRGWGGTQIVKLDNQKQACGFIANASSGYVLESYLEGIEVSVVVNVNRSDVWVSPVIFKGRVRETVEHALRRLRIVGCEKGKPSFERLRQYARTLACNIEFCGTFEIEAIVNDDHVYVTEVNGRLSGVTSLLLASGQDLISGILEMAGAEVRRSLGQNSGNFAAEVPLVPNTLETVEKRLNELYSVHRLFYRSDSRGIRARVLLSAETLEKLSQEIGNLVRNSFAMAEVMEDLNTYWTKFIE